MPTKIDIDPFFTSRAQSLERRYKDLAIRPKLQQTANPEQDPRSILESTDQDAVRTFKSLNISEDSCSQSGLTCHSNATAPPGSLPQDSWINAGFLGHECGLFDQNENLDVSTTKSSVATRKWPQKKASTCEREYNSVWL